MTAYPELLHTFVTTAPSAMAMFDADMRYLAVSPRFIADFGLRVAFGMPDDLVGHSHYDVFPDMPERWKQVHRRCLAGAVESRGLDSFARADGTTEWLNWEIRPWYSSDNEVGGITLWAESITDAVKAESELHRYQAVLEDQTEVICRFKADGAILYVNQAFCRLFGKTREELEGSAWHPVVVEGDRLLVQEKLDSLSPDHPVVTIENRIIAAGGEVRWGQFVNRAFFDAGGRLLELQSVGRDITELKAVEADLRRSEEEFRLTFEDAAIGVANLSQDGRFQRVNAHLCTILGYSKEELVGRCWQDVTHPQELTFSQFMTEKLLTGQRKSLSFEKRYVRKDGTVMWGQVTLSMTEREAPRENKIIAVVSDISERKSLEEQLVQSRDALECESSKNAMLLMAASDGIHILDGDGYLIQANDQFVRMLGYTQAEMQHMHVREWDPSWSGDEIAEMRANLVGQAEIFESRHRRKDGSVIDVEVNVKGVLVEGASVLYASSRDISERKLLERRVEYLAFHDVLTGLPNRQLLLDRLEQARARASRESSLLAVLYLDLDGFKPVNDSLGHEAGDAVLKEVAKRLQDCIRGKTDTLARMGGDEFVVVMPALDAIQTAADTAERICARISEPFQLDAQNVVIGASVGIAIYPGDGEDDNALLRNADLALYASKENGGGRYHFFKCPVPEIHRELAD